MWRMYMYPYKTELHICQLKWTETPRSPTAETVTSKTLPILWWLLLEQKVGKKLVQQLESCEDRLHPCRKQLGLSKEIEFLST